ncbi:MAG: dehydrogenase maturation factor, partial [bacterium]
GAGRARMSPQVAPLDKPALWPVDMPLVPRPGGPMWLGVAGKGGSGKSVLSGTLARILARRGHRVLAIDTDPMPGMAHSLGVAEPDQPLLMQAACKPEKGPWRLKSGIGPVTAVRRYTTPAPDGVRLMQLGKADKDGLTAVTGSVNAFLQLVRRMHEAPSLYEWAIVGDLAAGPRQPAAGFSPYARLYVVVVEPTSQSAMTGRRCARIARGPLGADVIFVASKVAGAGERRRVERLLGEPVDLEIPADQAVRDAERRQVAVLDAAPDSPVVQAVQQLADIIEQRRVGWE